MQTICTLLLLLHFPTKVWNKYTIPAKIRLWKKADFLLYLQMAYPKSYRGSFLDLFINFSGKLSVAGDTSGRVYLCLWDRLPGTTTHIPHKNCPFNVHSFSITQNQEINGRNDWRKD